MTSLIQHLDQGIIKTLKAPHAQYSMERIVCVMEENHNRENIMNIWKDYTIEDPIFATEKVLKAIKL